MRINKKIKQILAYALLIAIIFSGFSFTSFADGEGAKDDKKCSLKVEYLKSENISGVHFSLYRVADFDGDKFIPVSEFSGYSLSWNPNSSDEWKTLANTLKSYVQRDNIVSLKDANTINSECDFRELDKGLYYIIGDNITKGNTTYKSEPFFVVLPYNNNGNLTYDLTVKPKGSSNTTTPDNPPPNPSFIKRKVLKVWKNDSKQERPDYIEVQLLRDGDVYDTVQLTEDNNWRYTWDSLSEGYTWTIVEKTVPQGYTVITRKEGVTFVITNTKTSPDNPPDNPPDTPDNPPDNPPDTPDNPPDTPDNPPDTPDNPPDNPDNPPNRPDQPDNPRTDEEVIEDDPTPLAKLPQTGVLWWPVPVLFFSGLIIMVYGLVRKEN